MICDITEKTVFERIKLKNSINMNANINEEIQFIAKNFFKFSKTNEVMSFPLDVIESILFDENLVISNEDDVFNFIVSYSIEKSVVSEEESLQYYSDNKILPLSEIGTDFCYSSSNFFDEKIQNQDPSSIMINKAKFDNCFIVLLDSVLISNLSDNALSVFLDMYNFREMTNNIWNKVAMKMLNIPLNFKSKEKTRYCSMKFPTEKESSSRYNSSNFINLFDNNDNFLTLIPINNTNNTRNDAVSTLIDIF